MRFNFVHEFRNCVVVVVVQIFSIMNEDINFAIYISHRVVGDKYIGWVFISILSIVPTVQYIQHSKQSLPAV